MKINNIKHITKNGIVKDNPITKPYDIGYEARFDIEDKVIMKENSDILKSRMEKYNRIKTPRVGDYLIYDNKITRFTELWDTETDFEDNQIQTGGSNYGQYYLTDSGLSYSGGLDSGVKIKDLIKTDKKKLGSVWFFSQNMSGAHRGIYYEVPFRVYKLKPNADKRGLN